MIAILHKGKRRLSAIFKKGVLVSLRILLGSVFVYASIDKIAFPLRFAEIVQNYHILPIFLIKPFSILLPWIELFVGVSLIVGLYVNRCALISSLLVAVFMVAIAIRSFAGPIKECGCMSELSFLKSDKASVLILRDTIILMIGVSIFIFNKVQNQAQSD
jgi:uncharacterized membrane protein YphA (DoxX/SURF4 family)